MEEFPWKEGWKGCLAKMRKYALRRKIKQNDVIVVKAKSYYYDFRNREKTTEYYDFEVYWSMEEIYLLAPLGKLTIPPRVRSGDAFISFLDRFKREGDKCWDRATWHIEYGILLPAYQCYKKNPQELEQILKVAKTKKDLKLHLGVS